MTPPEPLQPFAPGSGVAPALQERLEHFMRAMSAGGAREDYLIWQSSCAALSAALEIIGEPAPRGEGPLKVGT
jgi:hypothetical protein